jgi:hypothetical protein
MTDKWKRREKKYRKEKHGMRVDSKSVFIIQRLEQERAEKIKGQKDNQKD